MTGLSQRSIIMPQRIMYNLKSERIHFLVFFGIYNNSKFMQSKYTTFKTNYFDTIKHD